MSNELPTINLFKGRGISFLDKFLTWALTAGRVVVILTEGIALAAFVYRFSLDAKLVNLHDEIKQQKFVIASLKTDEEKYRNLQNKLGVIDSLTKNEQEPVKIFSDIISLAPSDLTINSYNFSEDHIELQATVASLSSLGKFITEIKDYPKIDSVSLDNIENRTTTGEITITLTIKINGAK